MKVLSVVGARPQFIKLAPIARAMAGAAEHVIVHTGQHYDDLMSDVFFRDLGIPAADVNLEVGSGAHGAQTGAMMAGLEPVFAAHRPDWVLVYGDTNSTLAAAVVAAKMHLPIAHLEAGLRSFNRRMPEEHNRVLTDHSSDLLLAPTVTAMEHLAHEGLADRAVLVGDVMTDVLFAVRDDVTARGLGSAAHEAAGSETYYVATLHRPDNTDDPARLRAILDELAELDHPVLLLAHPRLRSLASTHGVELNRGAVVAVEPLAYPALVAAVLGCAGVVTDSGGLQKEAFLLRVPTTTIRPETEWVETVDLGWNVLAHRPADIAAAVTRPRPRDTDAQPYGDGRAAERVVAELTQWTGARPRG